MKDEFLLNGQAPVSEYFQDAGLRDLARAAAAGRAEEVSALIAKGIDPNGQGKSAHDKSTMTPLMWAVFAHNLEGVKALLAGGAQAQMPITVTRASGVSIRLYPLVHAASFCLPDILQSLLKHGADPETKDDGPDTVLMEAAGCLPCFKLLVEHGANVNRGIEGAPGNTAIFTAMVTRHYETVLYALQHGYNVDLDKLNYEIETGSISDELKPLRAQILEVLKSKNVKPWLPLYLREKK